MRIAKLAASIVALALCALVRGQTTLPAADGEKLAAEVDKLVASLRDQDPIIRGAAEFDLLTIGEPALALLRQTVVDAPNHTARQRIGIAIGRIVTRNLSNPTRVTLREKEVSLNQAFDALVAQADAVRGSVWPNLSMRFMGADETRRVAVDFDRTPFWEAIATLSDTHGLRVQAQLNETFLAADPFRAGAGIALSQRSAIGQRRSMSGPFMIVLDEWSRQLTVFADPKLRVLSYANAPDIDVFKTDGPRFRLRQSPRADQPPAQPVAWMPVTGNVFEVSVPDFRDAPGRVTHAQGAVRVRIMTRGETVVIPGNGIWQFGGRRFVVDVSPAGPSTHTLLLIAANVEPQAPGFQNIRHRLVDAAGNEVPAGAEREFRSDGQLRLSLTFEERPGAVPAKLILDIPVESKEIVVPFAFGWRNFDAAAPQNE